MSAYKLSWFCVGGRELLDFCVQFEIGLVFVRGVEIDLFFCARAEKNLVFVKDRSLLDLCVRA